ncbi:MAG TPA: cysteine hydrolase family protein [Pyrinomonadaceae bacterium]|jgi:nicotinamidase-related amidase
MESLFLAFIASLLTVKMNQARNGEVKTLLEFAGVESKPGRLSESALVIIDAQKEFTDGKLGLRGLDAALREARKVLDRARRLGVPVIHVRHVNKPGAALFDPESESVAGIDLLGARGGEAIVEKTFANAFFDSTLDAEIRKTGRKNLIVFGYMTHMAVDATVRAALERGYRTTVVGDACATRDLAGAGGRLIPAAQVHAVTLAALRDRFAAVVESGSELPD